MKILILILIFLSLSSLALADSCVSYTSEEEAAIKSFRRGNRNAFAPFTNEELDILKAKLIKEQNCNTINAITSGLVSTAQTSIDSLNSLQKTWEKQAQERKQNQSLEYQRQQVEAEARQADAIEKQNRYLKYGY